MVTAVAGDDDFYTGTSLPFVYGPVLLDGGAPAYLEAKVNLLSVFFLPLT